MIKNIFLFWLLVSGICFVGAQDLEDSRLATIRYGTENEIASLIQQLRNEGTDYLDDELVLIVDNTRNQKILNGVFAFFAEREKNNLENRAIRAIEEREDETNETVLSAIDYLGKVKCAKAVDPLIELLNTQERPFMNSAFRALGRAGSAESALADKAADYLIDFYTNKDPGDENRREVIIAIGATGSSNGVSLFTDIISNKDERIPLRIAALDAISKVGSTEGLQAVLDSVNTNDPNVRAAAVGALGPFSGSDVDKAIFDAFRDSYYRTRIAACQAAKQRKLAAAVPYLLFRAQRDEVPNVKDEAIKALGAIDGEEASAALQSLFSEKKNPDRVRLVSGEMLMKNSPDANLIKLILELDEAKQKNQNAFYNGLMKILGETKLNGDVTEIQNIARRFLQSGGITEKLYGLDMASNNNLKGLSAEIKAQAKDKNEGLSRKAKRVAEKLGIELEE
jgi:HEAT repeat protein